MWAAVAGAFSPGTQLLCGSQGMVGRAGELPECCPNRPVAWVAGVVKAVLQEQHLLHRYVFKSSPKIGGASVQFAS